MKAYSKPKYGIQADLEEWYEHEEEKKIKKAENKESCSAFFKALLNLYTPDFLGNIKIILN